jgi:hypothetical protein
LPVKVMFLINSIHNNTFPMWFLRKVGVFGIISKKIKQIVFA